FNDGGTDKSRYKRFKIKESTSKDDLSRIKEVLHRRFSRRHEPGWELPDLLLIDGGKNQLKAALEIRQTHAVTLPIVSLAKARNNRSIESIFTANGKEIRLDPKDNATHFFDRIRDEAHRFAITYHRKLRHQTSMASHLLDIPGIGSKTKKRLWETFGSIDAMRTAKQSEFMKIPGIGQKLALRLAKMFKRSE
ncbi:excinuclease ABC subunit C, partial [bacterium]|nr:excinuclease ABC subunit C [candidate division CSSED10-310 bacterium]